MAATQRLSGDTTNDSLLQPKKRMPSGVEAVGGSNATPPKKMKTSDVNVPTFTDLFKQGKPLGFRLLFVDLQVLFPFHRIGNSLPCGKAWHPIDTKHTRPQKSVTSALTNAFPPQAIRHHEVTIVSGRLEKWIEECDSILSSSDSFGLMNHGFDKSLVRLMKNDIQSNIQRYIAREYGGEQPVGTAFLIPTNHKHVKAIVHAPTRRLNYSIRGTDNVYMCVKVCPSSLSLSLFLFYGMFPL